MQDDQYMVRGHTTQQKMPNKWYLFRRRCRNTTEKRAAKNISAPRIIWYTLAVTLRRPMFMSTVAIRSNMVGIASMNTWYFGFGAS